jgi:hypothetical protein
MQHYALQRLVKTLSKFNGIQWTLHVIIQFLILSFPSEICRLFLPQDDGDKMAYAYRLLIRFRDIKTRIV